MAVLAWTLGGCIVALTALSLWLRRRDRFGYPSRQSEGEEMHPTPGVQFRRLEVPPSPPFD
jgi:hypothetical protein